MIQCTGTFTGTGIVETRTANPSTKVTAPLDLETDTSTVIDTSAANRHGITVKSLGATGDSGRHATLTHSSGRGEQGHASGNITVDSAGEISTTGNDAIGIFGLAIAGNGGRGGNGSKVFARSGSDGGAGGNNSSVTVRLENSGSITTSGSTSHGISAQNHGGVGGDGGSEGGFIGIPTGGGGGGGDGGVAGAVEITNDGTITTNAAHSAGIFLHSVGGFGGAGASSAGFIGYGASGGSAGAGGTVTATNRNTLQTHGDHSIGIYAQSVGGGGGRGGNGAGIVGLGGVGGFSGNGGTVNVTNRAASGNPLDARVMTSGIDAVGIFAQSVGGSGGDGGDSAGLAAIGGTGAHGGVGGAVAVDNHGSIITTNKGAVGIHAQSAGGGGGRGGSAAGFSSLGGDGGAGGAANNIDHGGGVRVANATNAVVSTAGDDADGIFAQSVGGGGGSGGNSVGVAPGFSLAIGGRGGRGGDGGTVTLTDCTTIGLSTACETVNTGTITTAGDRSHGLHAQSVGGGGGKGGFAIAAAAGPIAAAASFGGRGAGGGKGGVVNVSSNSNITTSGNHSFGISAESIGGGGGSGGFAISGTASEGPSLSFAMGGSGGSGGSGENVSLTALGQITTSGLISHGVFAQSVGGGGGNGGFAVTAALSETVALSAAFGGSGAGGGAGGNVDVTTNGMITTRGNLSNAIHAQSIGGGGGHGGFSVGAALTSGAPAGSFALGGSGGGGQSAGTVDVTSNGAILTSGDSSYGIFAQSQGGGGGSGGFSGAFSGTSGSGVDVGVSIGGSGSTAGHGSAVTVTSNGTITTTGQHASALIAQSIGGGGGHGGFALSMSASTGNSPSGAVSIGGGGAGGGNGGNVSVTTNNTISTAGIRAYGIEAQSIGGGGGTGGFALAGTLSTSSGSKNLSLSIGGAGGPGRDGAMVDITTNGSITTAGADAVAVFAQSIGGGGGNGGMSFSGSLSGNISKNADVTIGGNGGAGGDGGTVTITTNARLSTTGDRAHGIHAQSIGKGGGSGGSALAIDLTNGGQNTQVNVAVGGNGGSGGTGNAVNVSALGGVSTTGYEANAVYAQSIGGGGGNAGSAGTAGIVSAAGGTGRALQIGVDIGGTGGTGGTANAVTVSTAGLITTLGDASHGIQAQSIGGGGGRGGAANSFSFFTPGGSGGNKADNKSLNVSVGGKGGSGNHAGTVTVTNQADIVTRGADAYGIFAHSVGAGGGEGGHAGHAAPITIAGQNTLPPGVDNIKFFKNVRVAVGGSAGASGDGNIVNVISGDRASGTAKSITTFGDGSFGVFAQSIGAGGGIGGYGSTGTLGTFAMGGAGGAAGNGAAVTVDMLGDVTTSGESAHAIHAQSIGGGGGVSGAIKRGYANVGIGVGLQQTGGSGGDGGTVAVASTGTIQTNGLASFAILAQSVGGGGGVLGDQGTGLAFLGSVGGTGQSGDVTVTHDGAIMTAGDFSTGIFAQSASAAATGHVQVTLNGTGLQTTGADADGIFAQSTGTGSKVSVIANADVQTIGLDSTAITMDGAATTPLDLTIGNADIIGGSGTGTAVSFIGGGTNIITTAGAISALSGNAILATSGNDTIDNTGSITGNIDLGTGINAIFNRPGGRLLNNTNIALDGGTLTNAGDISPGGTGTVGTTNITGNYVQTSTGRYLADVDFSRLTSDQINVTGMADLNGELVVNLQQLEDGSAVTILTADGGAALSGINVADTLALNYGIVVDGNDVKLTVDYNFDIAGLSRNEDAVTQYINRALDAGASDALNPFLVALGSLTDPAAFEAAVAALDPEKHLSDTTAFYDGAGRFTDKVMSCAVHSGPNAAIAEGQCNWARVTQRRIRQDETNETVGYDQNTSEFAGGMQVAIAPNWRLGGAVGFNTTTSNNATYSSDGNSYSGGAVLKYTQGPWLFAGAVTVGHQETEGQRLINFPGSPLIAQSDSDASYVSGRFRAAYLIDRGQFYAKPMLDFDITQLHQDGFQETGAGAVSAIIEGYDETLYTIRPALQIGTTIGLGQTRIVRPFLEASVAFHPESDLILPVRFAGASASADPFQIKSSINETVFGIAGGLDMVSEDGVNFALRYDTEFNDDHVSHSGSFKMSIDF